MLVLENFQKIDLRDEIIDSPLGQRRFVYTFDCDYLSASILQTTNNRITLYRLEITYFFEASMQPSFLATSQINGATRPTETSLVAID